MSPAKLRPLQIFVVEDHPDTRIYFEMYLRDLGHSVGQADSIASALRALAKVSCDLLITDLGLPDGSGWDLLLRLRERRIEPPCAIMMSGFGAGADRARSEAAGFRYHLLKPLDPAEFEAILWNVAESCAPTEGRCAHRRKPSSIT